MIAALKPLNDFKTTKEIQMQEISKEKHKERIISLDKQIQTLKEQLEAKDNLISGLQERYKVLEESNTKMEERVKELEVQIEDQSNKLKEAAEFHKRINKLEQENKELQIKSNVPEMRNDCSELELTEELCSEFNETRIKPFNLYETPKEQLPKHQGAIKKVVESNITIQHRNY